MNLRDELLAIRSQAGAITPNTVKEAARPPDHPLHSTVFDKPVGEAAEAYYTERAHQLIRSVRIKLPSNNPIESREIRAFQAVRGNDVHSYVYEPSEEVAENPFSRELVLREMERDWRQLRQRYERFAEFTEMIRRSIEDAA